MLILKQRCECFVILVRELQDSYKYLSLAVFRLLQLDVQSWYKESTPSVSSKVYIKIYKKNDLILTKS